MSTTTKKLDRELWFGVLIFTILAFTLVIAVAVRYHSKSVRQLPTGYTLMTDGRQFRVKDPNGRLGIVHKSMKKAVDWTWRMYELAQEEQDMEQRDWVKVSDSLGLNGPRVLYMSIYTNVWNTTNCIYSVEAQ